MSDQMPLAQAQDPKPSIRWSHLGPFLEGLAKLLAIGVPMLYVLGRAYTQGYWHAIGLPESLMEYTIEDYLYFGFLAPFNWVASYFDESFGSRIPWAVAGCFGAATIVAILGFADRWFSKALFPRARVLANRWQLAKHRKWVQFIFSHIAMALASSLVILVSAIILALFVLIFALTYRAGSTQADTQGVTFSNFEFSLGGEAASFAIAHYLDRDGRPRAGIVSDCSSNWCVLYAKGTYTAFPTASINRIGHFEISSCGGTAEKCNP